MCEGKDSLVTREVTSHRDGAGAEGGVSVKAEAGSRSV